MDYFFNSYYTYTNLIPTDIYPIQYGEEQCRPGHAFGPCIRNNYIIHYVYSGTGSFCIRNQEYRLQSGQLFLIPPNYSTYYKADDGNPWLYRWIEFNGSLTHKLLSQIGLSATNPILTDFFGSSDATTCSSPSAVGPIGNALLQITESGQLPFEELMGYFWKFLSTLIGQTSGERMENTAEGYIKQAESYIKNNLHKNISVNAAADYIGIDRSYLCRLFNAYKNTSPKQYIDSLKMNRAVQYLKLSNISVTEVALSLGYSDCHAFNKAFKKYYGCSPSTWRKKSEFEQTIQE